MWAAGVLVGVKSLLRAPGLGLKRLALPVSYWRAAEFAYVWRRLECSAGARILDVGSPKDLASILARHRSYEVVATDILAETVALSRRSVEAQGLYGRGPGRVWVEVQDGRRLSYADSTFDAAFCVSVLEHIPDQGDTAAVGELLRVVKAGGFIVVTTPYDRSYRETFVRGPVYERTPLDSEPIFYERHYDDAALRHRLFRPEVADLLDLEIWGEGAIRVEAWLDRFGSLRTLLSPLEALLSSAFLHRIGPDSSWHPMAAFFTLRKR